MSELISSTQHITHALRRGVFALMCALFIALPAVSHAASYSFSPASGSYGVGESFTVRLLINTEGKTIIGLVGGGALNFDTAKLTLTNVAFVDFNLPVTEPKVGIPPIKFDGGKIGNSSGNVAVLSATFKGKAEGSANVSITSPQILQAGTSILTGTGPTATYTITPAVATPDPTPPPKEERKINIPPPDAPIIESPTHDDNELWYKANAATFTWDIPYGVLGLQTLFDDKPDSAPTELHEPPISEWKKSEISDGTWYFHAAYKNRGGWGSSTNYKIQIDSTPPEEFTATAVGGDLTAQIRFQAKDALSGIALYRVGIDGGRTRDVQESEILNGGYTITNLDPGEHNITVIAVDKAGNEREASATVTVTGTKPVPEDKKEVETSGFGAIYWVSLLFMAALAIVITMLIQERRKFHEEKDHIKRETAEAGDKLINIFGVLRDEIEEKVLELSHKPNMTDNERNILEGLKDALDISEELLDKEIEDVRKLLK